MTTASPPCPRVALLIDGDNMSHSHAGALINISIKYGALTIKRVYANMTNHPGWDDAPGFKSVHSGKGKNATDLLLAVEAMSIMLTGQAETLVIASSDRDFSHLAAHLTERGHTVIGMGEAKAPAHFRKSCTDFVEIGTVTKAGAPSPSTALPPAKPAVSQARPDALVRKVRDIIAGEPGGILITLLSTRMARNNAVQISGTPFKTWRKLLTDFPELFDCDPKGPAAHVRLKGTPPSLISAKS